MLNIIIGFICQTHFLNSKRDKFGRGSSVPCRLTVKYMFITIVRYCKLQVVCGLLLVVPLDSTTQWLFVRSKVERPLSDHQKRIRKRGNVVGIRLLVLSKLVEVLFNGLAIVSDRYSAACGLIEEGHISNCASVRLQSGTDS